MTSLWNRLRELPIQIEGYGLAPHELTTNSGFTRLTTEVELFGQGQRGSGEEVGWGAEQQRKFRERGDFLPLSGSHSLGSFSDLLSGLELSPDRPPAKDWLLYRRWAFESAALDLALRQNNVGLAQALGRESSPLHFAVSLGPHRIEEIEGRMALHGNMRFKLDATPDWSAEFCGQLAATGAVDVVDFKGAYVGTPVDVVADIELYRRVLAAMPAVIIEDPHDTPEVLELLLEKQASVAWDAPIHAFADLDTMPCAASALNIKPSRFGRLEKLLHAYEACEERGLPMYGGGQFELGVGRKQIQSLASIFHPDASNDVSPRGYHQMDSEEERPPSPLPLNGDRRGF
jgi:hypothetical protein